MVKARAGSGWEAGFSDHIPAWPAGEGGPVDAGGIHLLTDGSDRGARVPVPRWEAHSEPVSLSAVAADPALLDRVGNETLRDALLRWAWSPEAMWWLPGRTSVRFLTDHGDLFIRNEGVVLVEIVGTPVSAEALREHALDLNGDGS